MIVKNIELTNFRNYKSFSYDFSDDINVLIGENAQGKTNLIEAIYLLSLCRSFRTHINAQMIAFDEDYLKVRSKIYSNEKNHKLEVIISKDAKKAKVDGKEIKKFSDFVGYLNVIVFVPDDLELVKGSRKERRKFLDIELSKISPIYIFNLNKYQKLLKERNIYLKDYKDPLYLEVLDEQLAKIQVDLITKRIQFINKLSVLVNNTYNKISKEKEVIELSYHCFVKDNTQESIINAYKKSRDRDVKFKTTNVGIHKDDMRIKINGKDALLYASQGQQRTIVLAIKIALLDVIKEEIGEYPILLLDDVLSELDDHRKTQLLNILNNRVQTFITTTSIDGIHHEVINKANKIYIKNGGLNNG